MADEKQSLLHSRGLLSSLQRRAPPGLAWKAIPRLDAEMQESGSALAASWPESGVTVCLSFEVIITGGEKKKRPKKKTEIVVDISGRSKRERQENTGAFQCQHF